VGNGMRINVNNVFIIQVNANMEEEKTDAVKVIVMELVCVNTEKIRDFVLKMIVMEVVCVNMDE
jgi:hypothetical protein